MIVSIIASFLRRQQQQLLPLWMGVLSAVTLSLVIGILLEVTEQSLPQVQQEGMETVIDLIAVGFVSSMLLWMKQHSLSMKKGLEQQAAQAIQRQRTWPLIIMAFLAVIKEGFETSVFLLAAFSTASSQPMALLGAILGLVLALTIGFIIIRGSSKIPLKTFFKISALLLVFVAAGLLASATRSAHEAGWLTIGQSAGIDLQTWLPHGSISSALASGMFGISNQPRCAEIIAWLSYLVLMVGALYWPRRLRLNPQISRQLTALLCLLFFISAVALFLWGSLNSPHSSSTRNLEIETEDGTSLLAHIDHSANSITISSKTKKVIERYALPVDQISAALKSPEQRIELTQKMVTDQPSNKLTLKEVISRYQRVPPGLNPQHHPGPYTTRWQDYCYLTFKFQHGSLVQLQGRREQTVTLSGSGLTYPRTLHLSPLTDTSRCQWQTTSNAQNKAQYTATLNHNWQREHQFYHRHLPSILIGLSVFFGLITFRKPRLKSANKQS